MAVTNTLMAASTEYVGTLPPGTCSAAIQNRSVEATAAHEKVKAQVARENFRRA